MKRLLLLLAFVPSVLLSQTVYEWRGCMLDLSRHFFPVEHIYRQVDALSHFGVNVLHLHLTDAAGWRMEIKGYPRLTGVAAWRTHASWKEWWYGDRGYGGEYGGYYTQEQLRRLVAYAAERGVTIVPEIEMPGHSEEVFVAYPELRCEGVEGVQADFCAGSEHTFDFLFRVLDEVMNVFPSPYIHIGGDEAGRAFWGKCSRCQQRMSELRLDDTVQLQAWFMQRVCDYVAAHGRRAVCWDEVMEGGLNVSASSPVIMCWRGNERGAEALSRGFDVVMCPGSHCYFDNAQDAPSTQPEANGGYLPLDKVMAYRPSFSGKGKMLGVQGNLWAEYIATSQHAEYMLYPRIIGLFCNERDSVARGVEWLQKNGYKPFDLAHEIGERTERREPVSHLARGCAVRYNAPFNNHYRADGETTLTDGLRGGWANNDGRWQGFIGRQGMDVTIDLGKKQSISSVECDFQQITQPDIFLPVQFIVSVSSDGESFIEVHREEHEVEKSPIPSVGRRLWQGAAVARYVRVQALPGACQGWIFCDEVIVL